MDAVRRTHRRQPPGPLTALQGRREAADLLGISRSSLYVLLARGDVASIYIGASRRITTAALDGFVARLEAQRSAGGSDEAA